MGIEAHIIKTLNQVVARISPYAEERLLIAGGVATLLMRHFARAHQDPLGWVEKATIAILQL